MLKGLTVTCTQEQTIPYALVRPLKMAHYFEYLYDPPTMTGQSALR